MGRQSTAKERLLDAACELMLSRGYASIGVAEICSRAEVKKGSFYHFFESKEALTVSALDVRWQNERLMWTDALHGDGPALSRVERLIQLQATAQQLSKDDTDAVNGCLFGNLALELSAQDRAVQTRLEQIFNDQIALIQSVLQEAAAEGTIPPTSADQATARAVVAQLEGMVMFAKLANDPRLLAGLWAQTRRLLDAH